MKKLLFLTVPMILAGSIALTNNNITGTYADYERPKGDFVVEPKPFETVPGIGGKIIDITAPIGGFENTPKLRKYQYEDIEENGSYEGLYSQFTDIATRQSYLGYGYNIITSPYLDSDHVKMQYPIIDRDKIQSSSLVLDRKLYTNSKSYKATSMSEFAQSYGGSFKIYGNYGKVFSGGLALEYQAAQEEKEFYYFYKGVYNVRTFTLRMLETEESIMEMLSSQFANDLNSSMHPDTLFQRYGTHLILGATMGGRMEVNETYTSSTVGYTDEIKASINAHVKYIGSSINVEAEAGYSSSSLNENVEDNFESKSLGGPSLAFRSIEEVWNNYPEWVRSFNNDMSQSVIMGVPNNDYFIPVWTYASSEARRNELEQYFVEKADGMFDDLCGQFLTITRKSVSAKVTEMDNGSEFENSNAGRIDGNKGVYKVGETARLNAVPSRGYGFDGWYDNDGNLLSSKADYSFVVDDNIAIKARFSYRMNVLKGNGTYSNPYLIKTKDHVSLIQYDLAAYYKLANNIDFKKDNIDPIPGKFVGQLDGNNKKITNYRLDRDGFHDVGWVYLGLFEELGSTAVIKNLIMNDCYLTIEHKGTPASNDSTTVYAGILAGIVNAGASIENCDFSGDEIDVDSRFALIGIVAGYSKGIIKNCDLKTIKAYGHDIVGGIAGTLDKDSETLNCTLDKYWNSGKNEITLEAGDNYAASYRAGGICGYAFKNIIKDCVVSNTKFHLIGTAERLPAIGFVVGYLNIGSIEYKKAGSGNSEGNMLDGYSAYFFAEYDGFVGKDNKGTVTKK